MKSMMEKLLYSENNPLDVLIRRVKAVCNNCGFCSAVCEVRRGNRNLQPHLVLQQIKYGISEPEARILTALYCGGCGVCTDICPVGLAPAAIIGQVKTELETALAELPAAVREAG